MPRKSALKIPLAFEQAISELMKVKPQRDTPKQTKRGPNRKAVKQAKR